MADWLTEEVEKIKLFYPEAYERILEIGKSQQIWEICLANKKDDTAIELLDLTNYAFQRGVKDFAKFLMDKNVVVDADMPDLVSEFLQEEK